MIKSDKVVCSECYKLMCRNSVECIYQTGGFYICISCLKENDKGDIQSYIFEMIDELLHLEEHDESNDMKTVMRCRKAIRELGKRG